MAKQKTHFVCQDCGYDSVKWAGKCPGCGAWNTLVEEVVAASSSKGGLASLQTKGQSLAQPIASIPVQEGKRTSTGMSEMDRVLGGGIVPGSMLLVGGDPGIGKSTLLLQLSHTLAQGGIRVLYVSGEESATQLKLRAERLGAIADDLFVLSETDLDLALSAVQTVKPQLLIVDSIQTVFRAELSSAPGSVSQVRECTGLLLRVAKTMGVAIVIVGHVTKDGNLAGPRMLEHMVDAVLYFEGDKHHTYRVLRAVKNRFGSTNELALFEMHDAGLVEVNNPSELFLSERGSDMPGSAVVAAMEGSRPVLLEVQALIAATSFGTPRRMATGADYNRALLMLAVLERRLGMNLQTSDAYLNLAGGVHIDEPAIDLGIALAFASSFRDRPLSQGDVYIGEVGLTGEVRSVSRLEQRVREAQRLGFTRCVVPEGTLRDWSNKGDMQIVRVRTLTEALQLAL